jgi:hypothetical protein
MRNLNKAVTWLIVFIFMSAGVMPAAMAQRGRSYRYNDNYMRQLFNRLETRTDSFSNLIPGALDRSRLDGSQREDQINQLVTDFEHATDELKTRFESGQSTATDAQTVLYRGALINTFMRNRHLGNRTERAWRLVSTDLNRLAVAYNVARNWATMQWPTLPAGTPAYRYNELLTGTFRLNPALSNDPRTIAANATRNLNYRQRQRISDNLVERLTPPDMIAIERRGTTVTLASTRSPQLSFDVDGRERIERYPNGRMSRTRATFSGPTLKVVTNGDRLNDFTASFTPVDDGRRLLVTRELYAERLNQPVIVRSYYDRTSDIAQWNLYNPSTQLGNTGSQGTFVVPNGTRVIAVLNEDLSTQRQGVNERFTLTVREPYQYRNAIIEGHLTGVDRGGRISGRSQMTLDFDRIRMSNGVTYEFAGVLQSVMANDEAIRVDNEGTLEEESRTSTTLQRTAIGTAIGALVGAVAGGGKGAAIGAAVGAGVGAGSVYVQGRDDLELPRGAELTILASAP